MISQNTREATGWQNDPDATRAGKNYCWFRSLSAGPSEPGKKEGAEEKKGGGR
jgi:hypothetical protein